MRRSRARARSPSRRGGRRCAAAREGWILVGLTIAIVVEPIADLEGIARVVRALHRAIRTDPYTFLAEIRICTVAGLVQEGFVRSVGRIWITVVVDAITRHFLGSRAHIPIPVIAIHHGEIGIPAIRDSRIGITVTIVITDDGELGIVSQVTVKDHVCVDIPGILHTKPFKLRIWCNIGPERDIAFHSPNPGFYS